MYYRDPSTRQFKPITNLDGSKWSVRFNPSRIGDHKPIRFIKWKFQKKTNTDLDKRYSRKEDLQYIDL